MKTSRYTEMFPVETCDLADAIEALVDKVPRFSEQGLFAFDDFIIAFTDRFRKIVENLPSDETTKDQEIELAHILHFLYENHGLILSKSLDTAKLRTHEDILHEHKVIKNYDEFTSGETDDIEVLDPELLDMYLEYLYGFASVNIRHAALYLQASVRLSQIPGGSDILMSHIDKHIDQIPQDRTEGYLEKYTYTGIGANSYKDRIKEISQKYPKATIKQAKEILEDSRRRSAELHAFIDYFYKTNIAPQIYCISYDRQMAMLLLLNHLYDIVDPNRYISDRYFTGNETEQLVSNTIVHTGRILH